MPAAASKALKVLHDGFQQRPGHDALALPNAPERALSRLRVFAGSALELESLAFRARHLPARISDVIEVPEHDDGPWTRDHRFRISSRKSDVSGPWLTQGQPTDERAVNKPKGLPRERRMRQALAARLPYFELQSASTRQAFRLIVEPIAAEGPITADPEPDGFGLSVTTRPFALPSALRLSGWV